MFVSIFDSVDEISCIRWRRQNCFLVRYELIMTQSYNKMMTDDVLFQTVYYCNSGCYNALSKAYEIVII